MRCFDTEVTVIRGSVLNHDVEAIVNAANTSMRGGGALDGQVHRRAGPEMMHELMERAPHSVPVARPVITGGHNLKQKLVCHVAGPYWSGGNRQEQEHLFDAYRNSLRALDERGIASVGIPSVSTGVYRFPLELAAPTALAAMGCFLVESPHTGIRRIVWAMYATHEYEVFTRTMGGFEAMWEELIVPATRQEAAALVREWLARQSARFGTG